MNFILRSKVSFNNFIIQKSQYIIPLLSEFLKVNHNPIKVIVYDILNRVYKT